MTLVRTTTILALAAAATLAAAEPAPDLERRIETALVEARAEAGVDELERRPTLDAAARDRAERIAAMPHAERLRLSESARDWLDRAGVGATRRAAQHVDMNRGYRDPAAGFVKSWRGADGTWRTAIDSAWDGVGIGVARADDGWIVLVTFFVEDLPPPPDLADVERRTVDAVNRVRREAGLSPLESDPRLAAVARRHSEDMLRRDYFSHRSPEGFGATERVRAAGIRYRRLAENIHRSRGADDPVTTAVESWLQSPPHREAMLDAEVRATGVGVAYDDSGRVVFTQLFMLAAEATDDAAR